MKDDQDKTALKGQKRKLANEKENDKEDQLSKKPHNDVIFEVKGELLALIEADEKNKILWDELLTLKTRKDEWVEKLQDVSNKCHIYFVQILVSIFFSKISISP